SDPLYVDRALNDFHIQAASPAVDRGHPDVPALSKTDIDNQARVRDGDGDGTAAADLGADER
ncbi:MAG: hypothetical protein Q9Q13_01285, partial [Acidobacteriota bacterium]|nr:hypothetical protein [Acidobacteriota bacterium]